MTWGVDNSKPFDPRMIVPAARSEEARENGKVSACCLKVPVFWPLMTSSGTTVRLRRLDFLGLLTN